MDFYVISIAYSYLGQKIKRRRDSPESSTHTRCTQPYYMHGIYVCSYRWRNINEEFVSRILNCYDIIVCEVDFSQSLFGLFCSIALTYVRSFEHSTLFSPAAVLVIVNKMCCRCSRPPLLLLLLLLSQTFGFRNF